MFNPMTGQLPNSAGVKKLTIGVTGKDGKRAALQFQAESTAAPLVAIDETPEPQPPSAEEIELQYQEELKRRRAELGRIAEAGGEICQDDYEWASGIYANDETPLGDEMFGGE